MRRKSLARPGRKQATATKLGIYSTYSPRSSIHFLARCSNFCQPLKKIQKVVRPTRSPRQQWPRRTKNGELSIVFSVQGTGGSSTGSDAENREGDQDFGSPGRPFSSGLQVSGEPGHCRKRTRPPGWPSLRIITYCPQLAHTSHLTYRVFIASRSVHNLGHRTGSNQWQLWVKIVPLYYFLGVIITSSMCTNLTPPPPP